MAILLVFAFDALTAQAQGPFAPEQPAPTFSATGFAPPNSNVTLAGPSEEPEIVPRPDGIAPSEIEDRNSEFGIRSSGSGRLPTSDFRLRDSADDEWPWHSGRARKGWFGWLAPRPAPSVDDAPQQIYGFHGYSSWRGISDGSGPNNNGFFYGANFGTRLGRLSELTGIGAQLGGSDGVYDLNGRASPFAPNEMLQQGFLTGGLFRRADELTNFSAGVVFDGMFADNFGRFGASPFLGQLRYQVAYAVNERHEFGMWGTVRLVGETLNIVGPVSFRGVDQFNFFWHHKFAFGGDAVSWLGVPDHTKLGGNGSLGNYIFGGTLTAPLSPCWSAYLDLQYMPPSAHISSTAAREETFFLAIGIIFYPHRNSRYPTVASGRWMPYLPVANNGSFIVDTNRTF